MKPSELTTLLKSFIPAGYPLLVHGQPGVGKTDIIHDAAMACDADVVLSHPAVEDPTDSKGLPFALKNGTEASFLPFGQLKRLMDAQKRTVWFVDDFGQAAESVQKAYMQWLLGGELAGKKLSPHVTMIIATNGRKDKAGVSGILEPVKSRFKSIIELKADMPEWCIWAIKKGIGPMLLAFLRLRSDLLSNFSPTADMSNSPMPRTWYNLHCVEALQLPREIEQESFIGAVGEGAAIEYLTFRKMAAMLVSIDAILADPANAVLPKKPGECYAIATGLAARANDKTLSRIGTYITRMANNDQGEFAALAMRDCTRRVPQLANTADYVNLMCGPIGQLISGQPIKA